MTVTVPRIPGSHRFAVPAFATTLVLGAALVADGGRARAESPEPKAETRVAETEGAAATGAPGTTTVTTTATPAASSKPAPFGGSLSVETSIGLGTFMSGVQKQPYVETAFSPNVYYRLTDKLKLGASFSVSWYQVGDVSTSLANHTVLMSDISLSLSTSSIWKDEASGFNVAGSLRVGLPTSLASQFQNRLFTFSPSLSASIPVGPVSFSYSFAFGKYFNLTAVPTLDCNDFDNPDECTSGRPSNPNFGFESERRGPEVYLRGSGSSSFYFSNSLSIDWTIVEGLDLALGLTISNSFGTRSQPKDDLSSAHSVDGRSHSDRLVSSLELSYQIMKNLGVGASLVTATTEPFGSNGDSFPVIFNFTRAPDNITSVNISVTGSL